MKRFTMDESNRGELAKRSLSAKARYVIDSTDPCGIFEVEEDGEKKYYISGEIEMEGTLEEIEKDLEAFFDEYHEMEMQFEATPDGNILWGEDAEMRIMACVAVPDGASEDYGYLTMKKAILAKCPGKKFDFPYDGQEQYLEEDASAEAPVDLDIEIKEED